MACYSVQQRFHQIQTVRGITELVDQVLVFLAAAARTPVHGHQCTDTSARTPVQTANELNCFNELFVRRSLLKCGNYTFRHVQLNPLLNTADVFFFPS